MDEDGGTGVFRSEPMLLVHLIMQQTVAFDVTSGLGERGIVEFRDMNTQFNAYQRKFVDEIKRIDSLQAKLAFLEEELGQAALAAKEAETVKSFSPANIKPTTIGGQPIAMQVAEEEPAVPRLREIMDIEANVEELESSLKSVNDNLRALNKKACYLLEMDQVFWVNRKTMEFYSQIRRQSMMVSNLNVADFTSLDQVEQAMSTGQVRGRARTRTSSKLNPRSFSINMLGGAQASAYISTGGQSDNQLSTFAGTIRADKSVSFHRMLWRLCGANALIQFNEMSRPMEDASTGELVQKVVFFIVCQGVRLTEKVNKIVTAFHATKFELPEEPSEYEEQLLYLRREMKDLDQVHKDTILQRLNILYAIGRKENLYTWKVKIAKLKSVLTTMNLYRKMERGFIAECWVAASDYVLLRHIVTSAAQASGCDGQAVIEVVQSDGDARTGDVRTLPLVPPTSYKTNKFTRGFQNIVESYGIANYGEMNPMPYTIISFPFLFAVMFADAGHGLLMLLFAAWMVLKEKQLIAGGSRNEIWLTFFNGRYIILLMGVFSIYTGLMYNDIFAKSMNVMGTRFNGVRTQNGTIAFNEFKQLINGTALPELVKLELDKPQGSVYPFGVDPIWQASENKILFLNSFKMKLSVVLGVCQMFFGVMLSLFNHVYYKDRVSILFEFIPQMVFLLALFGYMVVLFFAKWLTVFIPFEAPSILIDFINMFLMKYPVRSVENPEQNYLVPWFAHKQTLQSILLAMALSMVPVLLLVKPIILVLSGSKEEAEPVAQRNGKGSLKLNGSNNNNTKRTSSSESIELEQINGPKPKQADHHAGGKHQESAGDIFIHQAIHTIEYCLSSISHTASYLRLWALSLAHSQLSEVLWSMVMRKGFASEGALYVRLPMTMVTFAFWGLLTVAILIVMEGLSAFLHALRLHWVEFQSKFYHGDGVKFKPFKLKNILSDDED